MALGLAWAPAAARPGADGREAARVAEAAGATRVELRRRPPAAALPHLLLVRREELGEARRVGRVVLRVEVGDGVAGGACAASATYRAKGDVPELDGWIRSKALPTSGRSR